MSVTRDYFIEAILLAAGASRRFNDTKQLALICGTPMLIRTITMLSSSQFDALSVVLGANAAAIKQVLHDSGVLVLDNEQHNNIIIAENWAQGMGASIATGIKSVHKCATHAFIGLSDQVDIHSQHCNTMIESSMKHPNNIVAAFYEGKLGAPAIFPRAFFDELALLNDDKGARDILRQNVKQVICIDIPEAAKDIDTKHDLTLYQQTSLK